MISLAEAKKLFSPYRVWVLAPQISAADANIDYYYDFSQSIAEYTSVFDELQVPWQWQPVTLTDYKEIIKRIKDSEHSGPVPLVLNLCDGDEINGAPGVSVIRELDRHRLIYTGADTHFYIITTSKIPMKKAFDKGGVPHAAWRVISGSRGALKGLANRIGTPMIIKPAVSGGSMGVGVKNVVDSEAALAERIKEIERGYRGWNLLADGLFVERFITGREFTTFITGSADDPEACSVYDPVERVFHPSLPDTQKFLSFDRLWEIYEEETAMPENENFYEYKHVRAELSLRLKEVSRLAYAACGGKGYGRLDIRMDDKTGELYVLEVNAQCGLSEDENYTSIGAIIKASGVSYTTVISEILKDALRRSAKKEMADPQKRVATVKKRTLKKVKK